MESSELETEELPISSPDLDDQVEADPSLLNQYLSEKDPVPPQPRFRSHSSYSSVVITMGPDGVSLFTFLALFFILSICIIILLQ